MCGPMALIGLAGSAVSAMGQMAAANSEASIHNYNAAVREANARQARLAGQAERERISKEHDRTQGQAMAGAAASGVAFAGSIQDLFGGNESRHSVEQNTNYVESESRAVNQENQANVDRARAKAVKKGGKLAAIGTVITGLGKAAKGQGNTLSWTT